jgi:replicative DNA helicase
MGQNLDENARAARGDLPSDPAEGTAPPAASPRSSQRKPQGHLRAVPDPPQLPLEKATDLATERAVLGAVVADNEALEVILDVLLPKHLWDNAHKTVYLAIATLARDGQPVNQNSVEFKLRDQNRLEGVGGQEALWFIIRDMGLGSIDAVRAAALRLVDLSTRRDVIMLCHRVATEGCLPDALSDPAWVSLTVEQIGEVAVTNARTSAKPVAEIMERTMAAHLKASEEPGKVVGVSTGMEPIDDAIAGLHRKEILLLLGRSGGGKSSLTRQWGMNVARKPTTTKDHDGRELHEWNAVVFAVADSMTEEQVSTAMACTLARVAETRLRTKQMVISDEFGREVENHWGPLTAAGRKIAEWPVLIHCDPKMTVSGLRAELRLWRTRLASRGWPCPICGQRCPARLALVVADTLQVFANNEPTLYKGEGIFERTDRVGLGLLDIAKKFDVAMVCISQLNNTGGAFGAPSIKTHVQTEVTLKTAKEKEGSGKKEVVGANFVVGKQRHGPETSVPLWFRKDLTLFQE